MCYVRERYNTLGHDVHIIIICRFGGLWLGHGTCTRMAVGTQSRVKQGSCKQISHTWPHSSHLWHRRHLNPRQIWPGQQQNGGESEIAHPCLIREKKGSSRCRNGEQAKHTFWCFSYHHLRRQCCNSILEPEYHRMQRKLTPLQPHHQ